MKLLKYSLPLLCLLVFSCKEEEPILSSDEEESIYGTYNFNGVEKDIVDAVFRVSDEDNLLLNLVDEDGRLMHFHIYSFTGEGNYVSRPGNEIGGTLSFKEGDLNYVIPTYYLDTSYIAVTDYSENALSGSFDFKFFDENRLTASRSDSGEFTNIPQFILQPIDVNSRYVAANHIVVVDSIHTRITNTFFFEVYLYGSTMSGFSVNQMFRTETDYLQGSAPAQSIHFGGIGSPLINSTLDAEVVFDGSQLSTNEIKGDNHSMCARFDNLSVDELPKPFGTDGELLLYREDQVLSFDDVSVNLEWGADTVVTATNPAGNILIVRIPPLTTNPYGMNTNSEAAGVDMEVRFYSSANESPDWTDYLLMHYSINEDGTLNLGGETPYTKLDEWVPTFIRMKNHIQ